MSSFDNLDEVMQLTGMPGLYETPETPEPIEPIVLEEIESSIDTLGEDFRSDYELVRQSYYYQQQMLLEASQIALQNAKSNDAPRTMEVFSTIMNSWASSNKELLKMHRDIKDIQEKQKQTPDEAGSQVVNNTQNNINFVGTPNDLMNELGSQFDQQLKSEVIDVVTD